MEKKRSFSRLKKEKNFKEFCSFCKKLTEEYANSETHFSGSYFTEHYVISRKCFSEVIKYAIETNLVEDEIFFKAMKKSSKNSEAHSKGSGGRSRANYEKMYTRRCQYIAMLVPTDEIKKAVVDFADNPDISKVDIATAYGWNRKTFEILLVKAIEENLVDDRIVEAIEARSINNADIEKRQITKEYFAGLKKKREANKKGVTLEWGWLFGDFCHTIIE